MGRIEGILFKALQEHARRINRSFKELGASIQAWFAGNREEVEKKVIIISTLEKEASKLKKNLLTEVASEEEDPHRPDYIRLILQMDEAAGFAGGAAVRLGFIDFTPEENDPIIEKFNRLITLFINIGDALTSAIKWADDNVQKALEYCDQIDSIESQIDGVYRELEAYLYSRTDIDLRIIMQIRTVALHLEDAADICQKVSDSLIITISF